MDMLDRVQRGLMMLRIAEDVLQGAQVQWGIQAGPHVAPAIAYVEGPQIVFRATWDEGLLPSQEFFATHFFILRNGDIVWHKAVDEVEFTSERIVTLTWRLDFRGFVPA